MPAMTTEAAPPAGRRQSRLAMLGAIVLRGSCSSDVPLGDGGGPPSLPDIPGLFVSDPLPALAGPTWSPDGLTIAYSASGCPGCQPSLYFVRADASTGGVILANGASPAWRP